MLRAEEKNEKSLFTNLIVIKSEQRKEMHNVAGESESKDSKGAMLIFLMLSFFPSQLQSCKKPHSVRPRLKPLPPPSLRETMTPRGSKMPQMEKLKELDVLCSKQSFCTDPPNYPDKQVTLKLNPEKARLRLTLSCLSMSMKTAAFLGD